MILMIGVKIMVAYSVDKLKEDMYRVVLFSDSKKNTPANPSGADIDGIRDDVEFAEGSIIVTADSNVAFKKEDGTWEWRN